MTLYRQKQQPPVEAIKFQYTQSGIEDLRAFAGQALGEIFKARHMDAVAEARIEVIELETLKQRHSVLEGQWLIKTMECGHVVFMVCSEELFHSAYEAID